MIREKKDIAKTSNSTLVGKEGKKGAESSPGNGVQYEVTYVGTAQQVELNSQNLIFSKAQRSVLTVLSCCLGGNSSTAGEEGEGWRFHWKLNFWADHVTKTRF